jgi:hypothetical protein
MKICCAREVCAWRSWDDRCIRLMEQFIAEHPGLWNEDIGKES